jgi:hypothetical protein
MEDAAVRGVPHGEPAVADDALLHHCHELAVVDAAILHESVSQVRSPMGQYDAILTYVVLVHLCDDVVEADVGHVVLPARLLQLVDGDVSAAVLVEVGECREQVLLALQLAHVHGGGDELVVVDAAALVHVGGVHQVPDLALPEVLGPVPLQPLLQLVEGDGAAAVRVHGLEHLLQPRQLLLRQALRDDPQRHLLQPVHGRELLQPRQHRRVQRPVRGHPVLADPRVAQHLVRAQPVRRRRPQHSADQVLGAVGDGRPRLRVEVDGPLQHGVEDALLRLRPERRHPAEEDVHDDPRRPHVRLGPVVLAQHLRRHVVGGAHHVGEHLAGLEEDGEAEVDGLERRVVAPVLEQEVLGLEVPVHDAQRVARLHDADDDARDLGGLALGEVPPVDDAVEELAALAELHHDVDVERVLVGALDGDDALVAGEVVHDLDLAPHVVDVLGGEQLALGDGLAGEGGARGQLRAQVRGAELPLPELAPHRVEVAQRRGDVAQHRGRGRQVQLVTAHGATMPLLLQVAGVGDAASAAAGGEGQGRRRQGDAVAAVVVVTVPIAVGGDRTNASLGLGSK